MKTIVIQKRSDDYHASLKDHPEIWGCGKTVNMAVGNLIVFHQESFKIKIEEN